MLFKIHNTEVKISFTFLGLLLISIISESSEIYFITFVSSLVHELVHVFFILLFKSRITEFSLFLLGARIKRGECHRLSFVKEAIISLSAPLFNIMIGLSVLLLTGKVGEFAVVNLFLGLFNILPFYSFDGGRGLSYLLRYIFSEEAIECIITVTSIITIVIFSFVSVYVFFNYTPNYILLVFIVYMIFCLIFRQQKGIFIKDKL